jgi:nucleoside-diphosphate-sugar epimerase
LKNILIIGANSILSVAISERFKNADCNVFHAFNLNYSRLDGSKNVISINNIFTFDPFFFETIYIIGAYISTADNSETLNNLLQTNIILLDKVSHYFKISKLVLASTVSIFKNNEQLIDENSTLGPINYYAISKLFAEKIVSNHTGGGISIRLSSLFGVNMNEKTFIPIIINQALQNKTITIHGNGSRMQNYISATEASEYFFNAQNVISEKPLLAINNASYSNLEIATFIKELLPNTNIVFTGNDSSVSCSYNNDYSRKLLSITEKYIMKKELKKYLQWKQKQF